MFGKRWTVLGNDTQGGGLGVAPSEVHAAHASSSMVHRVPHVAHYETGQISMQCKAK